MKKMNVTSKSPTLNCFHNQLLNITIAYTAAKLEFNTSIFKKAKPGNISSIRGEGWGFFTSSSSSSSCRRPSVAAGPSEAIDDI